MPSSAVELSLVALASSSLPSCLNVSLIEKAKRCSRADQCINNMSIAVFAECKFFMTPPPPMSSLIHFFSSCVAVMMKVLLLMMHNAAD